MFDISYLVLDNIRRLNFTMFYFVYLLIWVEGYGGGTLRRRRPTLGYSADEEDVLIYLVLL